MVDVDISIIFAGLSIAASIVYYASILRNANKTQQMQLETRQAQMFMGIYNQLNRADFIDAIRTFRETEWSTFEEYQQILGDSELDSRHLWVLGMFYEGLGVLVKNDLVPMKLIAETITGFTRLYWEKYIPIIEDGRRELNNPYWLRKTEYLYNELLKYLEEHPELAT